jgi:formylglycine-generating enzyme required for sulfatase activity
MTFVCTATAVLVAGTALSIPDRQQAQRAAAPAESYTETIPGTCVTFEMVAIPGGTFQMGSPASEAGREPDEGPQVEVDLAPFWIGKHEVTWDEFDEFAFARGANGPRTVDAARGPADAVTRPSRPYGDESRGFGKGRQPALGMTHHAAMEYCRWLSERTGKMYRLPTEAEWEFAARAGSTAAALSSLGEAAWSAESSASRPHPVGGRAPNAWGLHDMLGNVAEWVLDQYDAARYRTLAAGSSARRPVLVPDDRRYPHVVRGGSYLDGPVDLRFAARVASSADWSLTDPQEPKSVWWHPDESFVGFRVARAVDEQPELRGLRSKVTAQSR